MAETTKIEWAHATINNWWGCTKVSPGCAHCYADALSNRLGKDIWGPGKPREDHRPGSEKTALKLHRKATRENRRLRIFGGSMCDWLDPEVPPEWLADMLDLIRRTPRLDWLLLTKRPELWSRRINQVMDVAHARCNGYLLDPMRAWLRGWFFATSIPHNIWIGATAEDQPRLEQRLPALINIPARIRFLSCEPLLGPLDLGHAYPNPFGHIERDLIHWVICGGESGPKARPMHPDWAGHLRTQCVEAHIPFYFKQWGEWLPNCQYQENDHERLAPLERGERQLDMATTTYRVGKKHAGRQLDGQTWNQIPNNTEARGAAEKPQK